MPDPLAELRALRAHLATRPLRDRLDALLDASIGLRPARPQDRLYTYDEVHALRTSITLARLSAQTYYDAAVAGQEPDGEPPSWLRTEG